MWNAFYNPVEAVEDAKRFGEWGTTIAVMAISAVILSLVPLIWIKSFIWYLPLIGIVVVAGGMFLGALLMKIVLSILGVKNPGYFEMVTASTYSIAPLSVAFLAGTVFSLIPYVGIVLMAFFAVLGGITSTATYFRAVQDLAGTDLLTTLVAVWIVGSMGALLGYLSMVGSVVASFASLAMG